MNSKTTRDGNTARRRHWLCWTLPALALIRAQGAEYHVSPLGNDSNSGTATQPLRTITRAYSLAGPGDTITVAPGLYTDYTSQYGLRCSKSGTASSPIVLRSLVHGAAIIDGQNTGDRNVGIWLDGDHHVIDGFDIRGAPMGGITVYGSFNRILNNEFHHNGNPASDSVIGRNGVYSGNAAQGNIYGANLVHHNGRAGDRRDHGFYLTGDNELVFNNVLFSNPGAGLQVAGANTVSNLRVYNNVVAYNGMWGIILWMAMEGVDIKNNIIYRNGGFGIDSWDAHGSGVVIDRNLVFGNLSGDYGFTNGGSDFTHSVGTTLSTDPLFLNSSLAGFNPRLAAGSPAIGAGLNLSSVFATDFSGAARPASGAWDIGAFQFGASVGGPGTTPTIVLTAPAEGASYSEPATINLDASVNPNGNTIRKVVFYHGTVLVAVLGEDATAPYNAVWSNVRAGEYTLSARLFYNEGSMAASTPVRVRVNSGQTTPGSSDPSFASTSGTVTAPFVIGNGVIYQPTHTIASGGRAAYTFNTANAGSYVVTALVDAPDLSANSFYLNIDAEPVDSAMIWDIPVTSGLEKRTVSWRGSGTHDNNEFVPKVFTLSAGTHQLIVRGREANTQLGAITIERFEPVVQLLSLGVSEDRAGFTAPPASAITVASLNVTGSRATLNWASVPGTTYRVAYKNNLADANWIDLSGDITADGATTSWADAHAGESGQRYYLVYVRGKTPVTNTNRETRTYR
ncbi:MAG: right-handed parallel beta-helix repeat-containing protein [Verrucomicrobiota bacterium]